MGNGGERFYDDKIFSTDMEEKREYPFPDHVSEQILIMVSAMHKQLKGDSEVEIKVADLGSGHLPEIGERVKNLAIDINPDHIKKLQGFGVQTLQYDVTKKLVIEDTPEVVHMRTLLGFLPERERRLVAIENVLSNTGFAAVFLEYDYENALPSWQDNELMSVFGESALAVLERVGFNRYYGKDLEKEVRKIAATIDQTIEIRSGIFRRPPGKYYKEVKVRAIDLLDAATKIDMDVEADALKEVYQELEDSNNYDSLPPFQTPDLVAVVTMYQELE